MAKQRKRNKARISENSVLVLKSDVNIQVFQHREPAIDAAGVVLKTKGGKDQLRPFYSDKNGQRYELKDLQLVVPTNIVEAERFIQLFNTLEVKERSGYDSFVNDGGPTNPQSPLQYTPDGYLKILLIYANAVFTKMVTVGDDELTALDRNVRLVRDFITARLENIGETVAARKRFAEDLESIAALEGLAKTKLGLSDEQKNKLAELKQSVSQSAPPQNQNAEDSEDEDGYVPRSSGKGKGKHKNQPVNA